MARFAVFFVILISIATQAFANPDAVVFDNGDVRINGAGNGLVFPDGTIQHTATLQGPIGPQGPAGPACDVTLDSICNAISAANKILPSFCTSSPLVSITVAPANTTVEAGTSRQFTATGLFSDNSATDITNIVTWSSSQPAVATVSPTGNVTTLGAGTANIQAAYGKSTGATSLNVVQSPQRMLVTIAFNQSLSLASLQFTLTLDTEATYRNDLAALNEAIGSMVAAAGNGATATNIAMINAVGFNTSSKPILSLSYDIPAGSRPTVVVSPASISASNAALLPISLTQDNFVIGVQYF